MSETIFTVSIDFVASVAASLGRRLCDHAEDPYQAIPWLRLRIGTDDLPDAYRGLPVLPAQPAFLCGGPFLYPNVGLALYFCYGVWHSALKAPLWPSTDSPQLGIAISRRLHPRPYCKLTSMMSLPSETIADSDVSQAGLRLTFQLMGATTSTRKRLCPSGQPPLFGHVSSHRRFPLKRVCPGTTQVFHPRQSQGQIGIRPGGETL